MAQEKADWMDVDGAQTGGVVVHFFRGTKYDPIKTGEEGYPVSRGIDYMRVGIAGEKDNAIFEIDPKSLIAVGSSSPLPVNRRYPELWRAYKDGREQSMSGTSLEVLFPGSPEVVANLKANNIYTVQQLAEYPDSSEFKFGLTLKQKAQQFLDGLKGNRFHELERQAAQDRAELEEMKRMVAQLTAQQEAPKRRGRPPKVSAPEPAMQE